MDCKEILGLVLGWGIVIGLVLIFIIAIGSILIQKIECDDNKGTHWDNWTTSCMNDFSSESVSQDSSDCKIPLPIVNSSEDTVIGYIYWQDPYWSCEPICKSTLKPQSDEVKK